MAEESKYPHFTVTSLTAAVKGALERGWSRIIVEGEISGWRPAASGHRYFTLKDAEAQISAVMFSSAFQRCAVRDELKDGAKVALYCSLTVYPPRGNYQLNVLSARLAGVGELTEHQPLRFFTHSTGLCPGLLSLFFWVYAFISRLEFFLYSNVRNG